MFTSFMTLWKILSITFEQDKVRKFFHHIRSSKLLLLVRKPQKSYFLRRQNNKRGPGPGGGLRLVGPVPRSSETGRGEFSWGEEGGGVEDRLFWKEGVEEKRSYLYLLQYVCNISIPFPWRFVLSCIWIGLS